MTINIKSLIHSATTPIHKYLDQISNRVRLSDYEEMEFQVGTLRAALIEAELSAEAFGLKVPTYAEEKAAFVETLPPDLRRACKLPPKGA